MTIVKRRLDAVVADRAQDDPPAQQGLIDASPIADPEGHEIAPGRDEFQPQCSEPAGDLHHAGTVERHRPLEESGVGQCRLGGRKGQGVDVERRPHPVEQVDYLGRGHAEPHPQAGQTVCLGEGA